MALLVASSANVSWQGINPPGAGGDPLDYPATTVAAPVAVWSPAAVDLPEARRLSPPPGPTRTPLGKLERSSLF